MSVAETVRRVQDAEAEAEAILASAEARALEEIARARAEAARLIEESGAVARGEIPRLRKLAGDQEAAAAAGIEEAARAEMAEIRDRAARNRPAAVALLAGLAARLAGEGG